MYCIILEHKLKHLKSSDMFRSIIVIREHMQFLAEVCKMLKQSVKHFVKEVWQHICKRIVQYQTISITLFSKPKVIESLYQSVYMLTVPMHIVLIAGRPSLHGKNWAYFIITLRTCNVESSSSFG
jgi:hypothetical protein